MAEFEKWFRFRGMCFGKQRLFGRKMVEVMAPTVKSLREKLAYEIGSHDFELAHSYVDRILVHIYDGGVVESGVILRGAISGRKFIEEAQELDIYKQETAKRKTGKPHSGYWPIKRSEDS